MEEKSPAVSKQSEITANDLVANPYYVGQQVREKGRTLLPHGGAFKDAGSDEEDGPRVKPPLNGTAGLVADGISTGSSSSTASLSRKSIHSHIAGSTGRPQLSSLVTVNETTGRVAFNLNPSHTDPVSSRPGYSKLQPTSQLAKRPVPATSSLKRSLTSDEESINTTSSLSPKRKVLRKESTTSTLSSSGGSAATCTTSKGKDKEPQCVSTTRELVVSAFEYFRKLTRILDPKILDEIQVLPMPREPPLEANLIVNTLDIRDVLAHVNREMDKQVSEHYLSAEENKSNGWFDYQRSVERDPSYAVRLDMVQHENYNRCEQCNCLIASCNGVVICCKKSKCRLMQWGMDEEEIEQLFTGKYTHEYQICIKCDQILYAFERNPCGDCHMWELQLNDDLIDKYLDYGHKIQDPNIEEMEEKAPKASVEGWDLCEM